MKGKEKEKSCSFFQPSIVGRISGSRNREVTLDKEISFNKENAGHTERGIMGPRL